MTIQLDYARPTLWRYKKWLRRLALWIPILAALAAAIYYTPRVIPRLTMLYWQNQCATFRHEPDSVVAIFEPDKIAARRSAAPSCAARFENFLAPPLPGTEPLDGHVFLHARKCAAGTRIIAAYAQVTTHIIPPEESVKSIQLRLGLDYRCREDYWLDLEFQIIEPGDFSSPPVRQPTPTRGWTQSPFPLAKTVSSHIQQVEQAQQAEETADKLVYIYAGQPDPNDESAFEIPCKILGQHVILYFKLDDSGDNFLVKTLYPKPITNAEHF